MDVVESVQNIGGRLLSYESLGTKIRKIRMHHNLIMAKANVMNANLRNVRLPFEVNDDVKNWLNLQEEVAERSEQLFQDFEILRWFDAVKFIQLWRKTHKLITDLDFLIQQSQFSDVLTKRKTYVGELQNLTTKFVGNGFQASRVMINDWLKSDIVVGGICGMGGIGKTALLEDLYYGLESNPDYQIFWVAATTDFNIKKFQDIVARALGIYPLVGDDLERRVEVIKTLKLVNNAVIIVDDLWDFISLHEVGIPVAEKNCKVFITSRSMKVCQLMRCQKCIKMEPLTEEESWVLFKENCETFLMEAEVYAKELVNKCEGLPLGIIQLALYMNGVLDIYEWKDMLHRTKSLMINNYPFQKVFDAFQCSYENLTNTQLKKCFLFCSLFPKDFMIERQMLICCFIDEGLIDKMKNESAVISTGHTILNKLESVCLLSSVNEAGKAYINMHSLLRYFAIQVVKSHDIKRETDNNPKELMAAYGKWANTVAERLHPRSASDKIPIEEVVQNQKLEKLIWIAAFMLVGVRHLGATVGVVEKEYRSEVCSLIKELASVAAAEKNLIFDEEIEERLCAYSRVVADVPTAVKEFESRNGWFYSISKKAIAEGKPDPCPLHTSWLKELNFI